MQQWLGLVSRSNFDADSMLLLGSRFAKGFQRLEALNRNEAGIAEMPDDEDNSKGK